MDGELISELWDILLIEMDYLRRVVPDAVMSSNMQLFTKNQLAASNKNGGNAFGIDPEAGPLFGTSIVVKYPDEIPARTNSLQFLESHLLINHHSTTS